MNRVGGERGGGVSLVMDHRAGVRRVARWERIGVEHKCPGSKWERAERLSRGGSVLLV